MKKHNVFDEIVSNEEVSDVALCAIYDLLETLLYDFEKSAFYRIKQSIQEQKQENKKNKMGRQAYSNPGDPF